jgi:hypothetical protein
VTGRYRTPLIGGGPWINSSQIQKDEQTTDDTVGWWFQQNPFNSVRVIYKVGQASGVKRLSDGRISVELDRMPLAYNVLPPTLPSLPETLLELDGFAREIQAATNPSLPSINSPQSLGELKDLGGLLSSIRNRGFGVLNAVSSAYLTKKFAIDPMMRDLKTLTSLSRKIDVRVRELKRLRDGQSLKRRVGLSQTKTTLPDLNVQLLSAGANLPGVRHGSITVTRWGSAQWKLSSTTKLPETNDEIRHFAARLESGVTSASAMRTLWELFPWSWLTDWVGNYSQNLDLADNSVGLTVGPMCVMETTESKYSYSPRDTSSDDWDWALASEHYQRRIRKWRKVVTTVLPISLPRWPFLTNGHWSILGALAGCRLAPKNGLLERLLDERSGGRRRFRL